MSLLLRALRAPPRPGGCCWMQNRLHDPAWILMLLLSILILHLSHYLPVTPLPLLFSASLSWLSQHLPVSFLPLSFFSLSPLLLWFSLHLTSPPPFSLYLSLSLISLLPSPRWLQQMTAYTESGSARGFCLLKALLSPMAASAWSFALRPLSLFECLKCIEITLSWIST